MLVRWEVTDGAVLLVTAISVEPTPRERVTPLVPILLEIFNLDHFRHHTLLKQTLCDKLYKFKRLSHIGVLQHPNSPLWSTRWKPVDITQDVMDRQILHHTVSDDSELYALIDKLTNEQLPRDIPLWRFHYIENRDAGGLSMWSWRVAHGISDGIRLVSIASTLLQNAQGQSIGAPKGSILSSQPKSQGRRRRGPNWANPKTYVKLARDVYQVWFSINGPCDTLNAFKPDGRVHGGEQMHVRNVRAIRIDDVKTVKVYVCCTSNLPTVHVPL